MKNKFYIVYNQINGNAVIALNDTKSAKSVKKRLEKTYGEIYSILEAEVIKEIK